jgi:hypothetical protein
MSDLHGAASSVGLPGKGEANEWPMSFANIVVTASI